MVQETDPPSITPPVLPTEATTATPQPAEPQPAPVPLSLETIKKKTLETFFIEDLGPDEEEDVPLSQKRLVIDSGITNAPLPLETLLDYHNNCMSQHNEL